MTIEFRDSRDPNTDNEIKNEHVGRQLIIDQILISFQSKCCHTHIFRTSKNISYIIMIRQLPHASPASFPQRSQTYLPDTRAPALKPSRA